MQAVGDVGDDQARVVNAVVGGALAGGFIALCVWVLSTLGKAVSKTAETVREAAPIAQDGAKTLVRKIQSLRGDRPPGSGEDEECWAQAHGELESGDRRAGLWAKAFADASGNESAARANYLKWRAQQLVDEQRRSSLAEAQRREGVPARADPDDRGTVRESDSSNAEPRVGRLSVASVRSKAKMPDERLYEIAAQELEVNALRKGLYARAFSEAMGDDAKAKGIYIRLRVEQFQEHLQQREAEERQKELDEWRRAVEANPSPSDCVAALKRSGFVVEEISAGSWEVIGPGPRPPVFYAYGQPRLRALTVELLGHHWMANPEAHSANARKSQPG